MSHLHPVESIDIIISGWNETIWTLSTLDMNTYIFSTRTCISCSKTWNNCSLRTLHANKFSTTNTWQSWSSNYDRFHNVIDLPLIAIENTPRRVSLKPPCIDFLWLLCLHSPVRQRATGSTLQLLKVVDVNALVCWLNCKRSRSY